MSGNHHHKHSQISGKPIKANEAMPLGFVRESILELIKENHPHIDESGYISLRELKSFRLKHTEKFLLQEKNKLTKSEREIISSIEENDLVTKAPEEADASLSIGEMLADKVAQFVGSWLFVILFSMVCLFWMVLNVYAIKSFDPYPFILLNLVLSCIAALQAPLIMMSQNRQEKKDRIRSENDYKINLKAELEIQQLHEKMDMLLIKLSERSEHIKT